MFSKFFIDRPIFATVLALLFVVAGLAVLFTLPVAQYPDITPPTVQVSAVYPGANAETVAQTVGMPIEQQVNGVEGMLYMSSNASASGAYTLTVTFAVGTDVDMATVMVQNRVNAALPSLPEVVKVQGVTVQKQSSDIVMMLTLKGDSLYDGLYLTNYAQLNMVDPLTRVPGVGAVNVLGAGEYAMRIWLDPEALRIRRLTPQQVAAAIQSQNREVSAGSVGQAIGPLDQTGAFQYTLNVKGRLTSPEEFGNIILRADGPGKLLRLKDVATIELGSTDYGVVSKLEGRPAAGIAIYQLPGSNSLQVSEGVHRQLAEWAGTFPPGVQVQVTLDTTRVVHDSISEVWKTIVEALVLVVLVIFFFLQSWRAVLIPCLTIPVSLIGTLAVMAALGFSINTLTLFGLILAIAIVVDDAIVVTENATRLLDEGAPDAQTATAEAMAEITGPVIGVVLVLLAVFLPTAFVGGISGRLFQQFALTIAASTVISGFLSLTLTPAVCGWLLRPTPAHKPKLFQQFDRFNAGVQRVFERVVRWLLAHPGRSLVSYAFLSILALVWFIQWPTTFLPEEDDGYFLVAVQLPPAASLERTCRVGEQLDSVLATYPEVETYLGVNGFSIMGGGQLSNAATYFVVLKDWKDRPGKAHRVQAVVDRFNRQTYAAIPEAQVFGLIPPTIPGMGNTGGLQLELEDRRSLGAVELQKAVQALQAAAHGEPALASMSCFFQADVPQYFLQIDRDRVEGMGLQLSDVFSTLGAYLGQQYVNDFVTFGRTFQVKLQAGEEAQRVVNDVWNLSVRNARGKMVPFSSFVRIVPQLGVDQWNRYNLYPAAAVTCMPAVGYSSGQTIEAVARLVKEQLGTEFGYEWTSVALQELQSGGTVVMLLLLALLVTYLVLAAQYESWTSPVAAVMGLPIAVLGAMVGCWAFDVPVSIYTQIGLVLLTALAAKNGILIVEFARDYRQQGNDIRQAAFEAGRVRLRPILMTSFTFVLGVMPLLFATGAGAGSRIALGAAVVFGMAVNTVVATLFIPNGYEWMQTLQEK